MEHRAGPATVDEPVEVSAVMPCLDEARTLGTCITKAFAAFDGLGVRGEVVVADNGSTDGSRDIARSLGARVVDVPRRGYGAALMGGIEAARGSIIVMGDSDDSYDWTAIGPFIDAIRSGDDLVMGDRFAGGIRPGAMTASHRYIGNPLLSFISRVVFRTRIGDFHCGMRALTPEAYARMQLRTPGMEFATEMVANAVLEGLRIGEVPVVLYPDGRGRPPHLDTFRDGWRHLRFIVTYAPDQLFIAPGILFLFLGILLVALLSAGPVVVGPVYLGIHWLAIGSMLALIGTSLFTFGTVAKVVIRRRHPTFDSRIVDWVLHRFRVEAGLLAGLGLAAIGAAVVATIVIRFVAAGGGPSEGTVHPFTAAATVLAVGVEIALGSFLLRLVAEEAARDAG